MPVFVACPACGCRVQMTEGLLGQRVRCIACQERFVADPTVQPPPPPPRRPPRTPAPPPEEDALAPDGRPFCPGCGRRVNWDWITCYHCGEAFDYDELGPRRPRPARPRRDSLPHRGVLLANLGNLTLLLGALSLCVFGLGLVVTVPLGVATIVFATLDLGQMRTGAMDLSGREMTRNARGAAITGLALNVLFALGWLLLYFTRI